MDFEIVKERIRESRGIAWDTCHKIYVLMDDEQMELMREYEYETLISADDSTPEEMISVVRKWWAASCDLRFIDAVRTHPDNPNLGFETLIGQFEEVE